MGGKVRCVRSEIMVIISKVMRMRKGGEKVCEGKGPCRSTWYVRCPSHTPL